MFCDLVEEGERLRCRVCGRYYPKPAAMPLRVECGLWEQSPIRPVVSLNSPPPQPKPPGGPGTELMAILTSMGIDATEAGCKCKSRAAAMDTYGSAWCRQNLPEIIAWLVEEAERRKWPLIGTKWVKKAAEFAAKRLILAAIEKAEKKAAQSGGAATS